MKLQGEIQKIKKIVKMLRSLSKLQTNIEIQQNKTSKNSSKCCIHLKTNHTLQFDGKYKKIIDEIICCQKWRIYLAFFGCV